MKPSSNITRERKEGGYGWVIVLVAFVVIFINDGIMFSFGIILVELFEVFQEDRARTAAVGSVKVGATYLIGPVAAYLADRYGCRTVVVIGSLMSTSGLILSAFVPELPYLYVTYGLITGVGCGMMILPVNVSVMQHFSSRKALATGLAVCGSGAGTFAFNPMSRYFADQFGLRGTFLLQAGISLHCMACGLLLATPDQLYDRMPRGSKYYSIGLKTNNRYTTNRVTQELEQETYTELNHLTEHKTNNHNEEIKTTASESDNKAIATKDKCRTMCNFTLLRNPDCLMFLVCIFLVSLAMTIPYSFLPDQLLESGTDDVDASWLVSSIGLASMFGRAVIGWIGDKPRVNSFVMFECLLVLAGIATSLSPLLDTFYTKLVYTVLFGFLIGGFVTMASIVQIETFGSELFSQSFGLFMFSIGLSSTAATPLGGWMFDKTGSYDITFVVAGCEILLSALVVLLPKIVPLCQYTRHHP